MENYQTNPNEPINLFDAYRDYLTTGLTKREYFAAMALQGLITRYGVRDSQEEQAIQSVIMADALIKELNKKKIT